MASLPAGALSQSGEGQPLSLGYQNYTGRRTRGSPERHAAAPVRYLPAHFPAQLFGKFAAIILSNINQL